MSEMPGNMFIMLRSVADIAEQSTMPTGHANPEQMPRQIYQLEQYQSSSHNILLSILNFHKLTDNERKRGL